MLDSDALVLADVAGLHDTDLEGCVIAACVDPFIPTVSSIDGLHDFARSGMPADTPYFNAGMMVADLRRWRQERVGKRSLQYIEREHRHLRQYDQDALNAVLAGRWKLLDGSWNTQPRTPNALGIPLPRQVRIVHFSGRLKPWVYRGRTELDRLYLETLHRTDWHDFRLQSTWQARAWTLYDSPLRRLVHGIECRMHALQRAFTK